MKILLIFLALFSSYCLAKDVFYKNYKFTIPNNYSVFEDDPIAKKGESVYIVNKSKKAVLVLGEEKSFSLEDYGESTYRDLFYELFGSHATENKAVLEFRRFNGKYDLQKFEVSKKNGFVFFRTNNSMNGLGETVFLVSTPLDDEVLNIYFTNKANEAFINSIIDSLKVK